MPGAIRRATSPWVATRVDHGEPRNAAARAPVLTGLSRASPAGLLRHERRAPRSRGTLAAGAFSIAAVMFAALLIANDFTPGRPSSLKAMALIGAAGFGAAGVLAGRRRSTQALRAFMLRRHVHHCLALRFATDDRWRFSRSASSRHLAVGSGSRPRRSRSRVAGCRATRTDSCSGWRTSLQPRCRWRGFLLQARSTFVHEECRECPPPVLSLGEHSSWRRR